MPLTGSYATDGTLSKEGLDFAVDEINANGGVLGRQLEVEYFDIQDMAPERVIQAADTLVGQKKVDAVIAGWVGAGGDVQAFGRYPVPYLMNDGSTAAVEAIAEGGYKNCFQMLDVDVVSAVDQFTFSAWLDYPYPSKTVMTIGADDDWGNSMTEAFASSAQAAGWQVVDREIVPYGTTDWGPMMSKIAKHQPALLYMEAPSAPDMLLFLQAFKQTPTNTILNFGYGLQMPDLIRMAGSKANGVIGMAPGSAPPLPAATADQNAWYEKFSAEYGHPIAGVGATCYSAMKMWAAAAEAVGDPTDYDAVTNYLATNTFENTIPGWVPLKFGPGNYIESTGGFGYNDGQIQDGELVTLYNSGKPYTDWQGQTRTFQTPSWIK